MFMFISATREAGCSHDPQDTLASLCLSVRRTRRLGIMLQFFPFKVLVKFKITQQPETVFLWRRAFCFSWIFQFVPMLSEAWYCPSSSCLCILHLCSVVPLSMYVQYFINLPSICSCFLPAIWQVETKHSNSHVVLRVFSPGRDSLKKFSFSFFGYKTPGIYPHSTPQSMHIIRFQNLFIFLVHT